MDTLRHVRVDGYTLLTWDTHRTDRRGTTTIGYRFSSPDGVVIFEGEDFNGSPMWADDSDEVLRALLGFLTLRPGDTDRDYFDDYTPEQLAFARGDAEGIAAGYCCDDVDGAEFVDVDED